MYLLHLTLRRGFNLGIERGRGVHGGKGIRGHMYFLYDWRLWKLWQNSKNVLGINGALLRQISKSVKANWDVLGGNPQENLAFTRYLRIGIQFRHTLSSAIKFVYVYCASSPGKKHFFVTEDRHNAFVQITFRWLGVPASASNEVSPVLCTRNTVKCDLSGHFLQPDEHTHP